MRSNSRRTESDYERGEERRRAAVILDRMTKAGFILHLRSTFFLLIQFHWLTLNNGRTALHKLELSGQS